MAGCYLTSQDTEVEEWKGTSDYERDGVPIIMVSLMREILD